MDGAQRLRDRIAELEQQREGLIRQQQELVNVIMRMAGGIMELQRLLAETEKESEGEDANHER